MSLRSELFAWALPLAQAAREKEVTQKEAAAGLTQGLLLVALILVLTAVVFGTARRLRRQREKAALDATAALTQFRNLHEQGGLSDEEYQTIKKRLASDVKSELSN